MSGMQVTIKVPEKENQFNNVLIPPGMYEADLVSITEKENTSGANPKFPTAKVWPVKWVWKFKIVEEGPGFGVELIGKTNPTVANDAATGWKWAGALMKRNPFISEDLNLVGLPACIEVVVLPSREDGGEDFNLVNDVKISKRGSIVPPPAGRTVAVAAPPANYPAGSGVKREPELFSPADDKAREVAGYPRRFLAVLGALKELGVEQSVIDARCLAAVPTFTKFTKLLDVERAAVLEILETWAQYPTAHDEFGFMDVPF